MYTTFAFSPHIPKYTISPLKIFWLHQTRSLCGHMDLTPSKCSRASATKLEEWKLFHKTPEAFVFVSIVCQNDRKWRKDQKVRFCISLISIDESTSFHYPTYEQRSLLLGAFQEFVLVLIKLRLVVPHQDLAYRFNVSRTAVSEIILTWLTVMDVRLSLLTSFECLAKSGTTPKKNAKIFYRFTWFENKFDHRLWNP